MDKQCFLTQRGPKAVGPYSTAVVSNRNAYLSGMIPLIPETGVLVEGDISAQTTQIFENLKIVLGEMGLSLANVIKATVFLTDLDTFVAMNTVYKTQFEGEYPARSCVQVSRLPMGASIEIEVIAAYPD